MSGRGPTGTAAGGAVERRTLVVIGAGPCGLGVGIAARGAGVDCLLLEKRCVASSIAGYPTFMTFFSTADRLEIGGLPFIIAGDKPTRREALRYFQRLVPHFELDVRQYEEVTSARLTADGFLLETLRASGETRRLHTVNVVVATGYFDAPNALGVPGEELAKVAHAYREGHAYFDQDCIVVGGGNSSVDAALELHRWGARVTLVHFADALDPNVKPWVRPDIEAKLRSGEIGARFGCRIAEVRPDAVVVRREADGTEETLANDWVLAMTGYTPRGELLRQLGVRFDPVTGIPEHDTATMETNVPGVFIAGVLAAGNNANKVFIENGRDHGGRIIGRIAR